MNVPRALFAALIVCAFSLGACGPPEGTVWPGEIGLMNLSTAAWRAEGPCSPVVKETDAILSLAYDVHFVYVSGCV